MRSGAGTLADTLQLHLEGDYGKVLLFQGPEVLGNSLLVAFLDLPDLVLEELSLLLVFAVLVRELFLKFAELIVVVFLAALSIGSTALFLFDPPRVQLLEQYADLLVLGRYNLVEGYDLPLQP